VRRDASPDADSDVGIDADSGADADSDVGIDADSGADVGIDADSDVGIDADADFGAVTVVSSAITPYCSPPFLFISGNRRSAYATGTPCHHLDDCVSPHQPRDMRTL